jgi:hypothetical protein
MPLVAPVAPAYAFRLVVQADDDADPIDFVLAAASTWVTEARPIVLAVNATGRDLAAYARRYPALRQVTDDAGRPVRAVAEICEVLRALPDEVGVVVLLDTNMIYRALRTADRSIDRVKNLDPGRWDVIGEGLLRLGELIARAGRPSIFLSPTTDAYGLDHDGRPGAIVGSKPHAWRGLLRSAHAAVHVYRTGSERKVEILADDWRALGEPGSTFAGWDGAAIGEALADVARASSPAWGVTTLEENVHVEIAARERAAVLRRERSAKMRSRVCDGEALLRAAQGPDAWARFSAQVCACDLTDDDQRAVTEYLASEPVRQFVGMALAVASVAATWANEGAPVERVVWGGGQWVDVPGPSPQCFPHTLDAVALECHALATFAGVWSEGGIAAASVAAKLPARGREWGAYSAEELKRLASTIGVLAAARRAFGDL